MWKDVGAGMGMGDPYLWADLCSYSEKVFPPPHQRAKQFLQQQQICNEFMLTLGAPLSQMYTLESHKGDRQKTITYINGGHNVIHIKEVKPGGGA